MKNIMFFLTFFAGFNLFGQDISISLNEGTYSQSAVISNESLGKNDFFYKYKQSRIFSLNPMLKRDGNIVPNAQIVLDLFPGKSYTGNFEIVKRDINNTLIIKISIKDYLAAFCVITTSADGISSIRIEIPQLAESYITVSNPETGILYLAQMDMERQDDFKCETINMDLYDNIPINKNPLPSYNLNSIAEIDILVVYTPAAEAYSVFNSGGINNVLATFMSTSQTVMDNSLVEVALNLVHSQSINYTETGDSITDLLRLIDPIDGMIDEVHQWRQDYNADLVILLTTNNDVGGATPLLTDPAGIPEFGFNILNIPKIINSLYTPIHEIGHNLGCHHHKLQNTSPGPGLFDYSAGWRWTSSDNIRYCSVVTYESGQYFDDGMDHSRIPYFSNPDINYIGAPIGHPVDGDNAKTIRETKHVIAAYSEVLGLIDFNREQITIAPNPTSGILEIFTQSPVISLKIFDSLGKLLQKDLISPVDLGGYDSGIYFIQLETNDGISVKKIIKE